MSDEEKVVDLDAYRKRRIEEGTWPPDPSTVVEYWRERRRGQKSSR